MNISSVSGPQAHVSAPVEAAPVRAANEDQRALIQAVKAVNGAESLGQDHEITFVIDRRTRRAILRIVNRETGETVRQIPPEEVLRLADGLKGR
jgi:flagellar protein FlaG